jgi:hypothetical protein
MNQTLGNFYFFVQPSSTNPGKCRRCNNFPTKAKVIVHNSDQDAPGANVTNAIFSYYSAGKDGALFLKNNYSYYHVHI